MHVSNFKVSGDGRFLFRCAELTHANVVGVEINEERVEEVRTAIEAQSLERCNVICENALNLDYKDATVVFLYLIPRGLRLILPILLAIPHKVRIATYMTPFPEDMIFMKGSEKVIVHVGDQEVQYPLYLYETSPASYSDSAQPGFEILKGAR